jgi:hypothetical protein
MIFVMHLSDHSSILFAPPKPSVILSSAASSSGPTRRPVASASPSISTPLLSSTFLVWFSMYRRRSLAASSSRRPAEALPRSASFGRRSSSNARRAGSCERVNDAFVSRGPVVGFFEAESVETGVMPSDVAPLLCVKKEKAPAMFWLCVGEEDPSDLRFVGAGTNSARSCSRSALLRFAVARSAVFSFRVSCNCCRNCWMDSTVGLEEGEFGFGKERF